MNLSAIYAKTASGLRIRKSLFGGLSSNMKRMLDLVDGHKSLADIFKALEDIPQAKRIAALEQLERDGYIKYLTETTAEEDEEWALETVFSPMVVEEVDTLEDIESSLALDEALLAELEQRRRLDEERKTQEIAEQIRAREQAKLDAQAKKAAQIKEQAKEKARLEAEKIQHELALKAQALALEEERRVQAQQDQAAKAAQLEVEKKARQVAEELESERSKRVAEENLKKEQEANEKAKLEAQALVAKIHAKEQARREQARLAREAELALKQAEEMRKAALLQAAEAAEKVARAEAEALAIAEAKERGRIEGERILREAKEAQLKLEVQAQEKAEQEARLIAEKLALQKAAEEKAIAEAKELERQNEERLTREAEERRQASEAQARAAEERLLAEAREQARLDEELLAQESAEKQRQLEAQLRIKIQQDAQLAAQKAAEARAKAKEEAKIEKARIKQEKADKKAKEKAQAQARKEAERIAKEEKKAALQNEKIKQQVAIKQAKEDSSFFEEDATEIVSWRVLQAQAQRKKNYRKTLRIPRALPIATVKKWSMQFAKLILIYVPILAFILLVIMHLANLSMLIEPIQKIASTSLGEPVVISEVRASLWPQPHLLLKQVRVGNGAALNIESLQVFPVMSTFFDDSRVINSVMVDGMSLDQADFAKPARWLDSLNQVSQLNIQAIRFNRVQLHIRDAELGLFDGQIVKDTSQHWRGVEMSNAEKTLNATITPQLNDAKLVVTGQHWPLPFNSKIEFDSITLHGVYQSGKLTFSEISGEVMGGTFTSTAVLDWADKWLVSGDFKLDEMNTEKVLKIFDTTNVVDGKLRFAGKFKSQSNTFNGLAEMMDVTGNFLILNSKINGIDLPRAIATPADRSLEGYATSFDQLSGSLQANKGHLIYRDLVLKSPKLQAQGQLEFDAEHNLSGKITANLITSTRHFQERFNLTGKVDNVKRQ